MVNSRARLLVLLLHLLCLPCSFKRAGQPGPLTRLLSCTEEKLKAYKWLDIVPTFVVPDVEYDEEHEDHYTAYNKPFAVAAWLRVSACTVHVAAHA